MSSMTVGHDKKERDMRAIKKPGRNRLSYQTFITNEKSRIHENFTSKIHHLYSKCNFKSEPRRSQDRPDRK